MPETSALCFSTFSSVPRPKETTSTSSSSYPSSLSNPSFPLCKFPYFNIRLPHRSLRFVAKSSGSGNFLGDDAFGHFPWESPDSSIQWVPEKRVTLFTADGLVQIGGDLVPQRIASSDKRAGNSKTYHKFQRFQESQYMDPNQGLCLGALFDIAATNGLDTGRRLCIYGFCRSIEMLSDVVEDTVLEHGGEVVVAEKAIKGDLHEKLTMTVAVPLLWGVPPASETLHLAVKSGGGIVEKVYWQWNFL